MSERDEPLPFLERVPTILLLAELRRRGVAQPLPPEQAAGLTRRQRDVYLFIRQEIEAGRPSPSIREIAAHFGVKGLGCVHEIVGRLADRGVIRKWPDRWRSIGLA